MVDFCFRRPRPFGTRKHTGMCQCAATIFFLTCLQDKIWNSLGNAAFIKQETLTSNRGMVWNVILCKRIKLYWIYFITLFYSFHFLNVFFYCNSCVWLPMFSVREASPVLNCWILVCMRLARLQRMAGIVWAFLSRGKSLDTHVSWLLQEEKKNIVHRWKLHIQQFHCWRLISYYPFYTCVIAVYIPLGCCHYMKCKQCGGFSPCKWCRFCCVADLPANVSFSDVTKLNQTDPAQTERLY